MACSSPLDRANQWHGDEGLRGQELRLLVIFLVARKIWKAVGGSGWRGWIGMDGGWLGEEAEEETRWAGGGGRNGRMGHPRI